MANTQPLVLTSLDFDTLKQNFIAWLQGQTQFADYNFDASNINVLTSLLSYNTYLNSFYLNQVASEAFLDSAQLIDSAVSHAKLVNYTPGSYTSAQASLTLNIASNQGYSQFSIPKGTQFTGTNSNGTFGFVTAQQYVLNSVGNTFTFANVEAFEGSYINESFIVDTIANNSQIFTLSNANVDVSSIVVTVYEDNGSSVLPYNRAYSFFGINSVSQVYFVQAYKGSYQIVFGDDVFGRTPQSGATVLATYRVCSGDAGNSCSSLSIDQDLGALNGGTVAVSVVTVANSTAGSLPEAIESIKYRAPRAYETQDRAITADDYETLIIENFPDIKAVAVYGGETITGAVLYGTTFLCPITQSGAPLSMSRTNDLISFVESKMTLGFDAVSVSPTIVYVVLTVNVEYDDTATNLDDNDMESLVFDVIAEYNEANLATFNALYSSSQLLAKMQTADPSIVTVDCSDVMYTTLAPTLQTPQVMSLNFRNAMLPGTIYSSSFQLSDGNSYSFTDNNPNLNTLVMQQKTTIMTNTNPVLWLQLNAPGQVSYKAIGTISYATGTITASALSIASFLNSPGIRVYATPANQDITGVRNMIVEIDTINSSVIAAAQ